MIEITLLRISPDSKYLDIIAEVPSGYRFDALQVYRYTGENQYEDPVDCSGVYNPNSTKQILRIKTNSFGEDVTIYKVEFGATTLDVKNPTLSETAYCSNVNFVYENLLDLLLNVTNDCINQNEFETLNRNHAILYAHTEAMRLGRFREAEMFYDIIWNSFVNCGPEVRRSGLFTNNCGC